MRLRQGLLKLKKTWCSNMARTSQIKMIWEPAWHDKGYGYRKFLYEFTHYQYSNRLPWPEQNNALHLKQIRPRNPQRGWCCCLSRRKNKGCFPIILVACLLVLCFCCLLCIKSVYSRSSSVPMTVHISSHRDCKTAATQVWQFIYFAMMPCSRHISQPPVVSTAAQCSLYVFTVHLLALCNSNYQSGHWCLDDTVVAVFFSKSCCVLL